MYAKTIAIPIESAALENMINIQMDFECLCISIGNNPTSLAA